MFHVGQLVVCAEDDPVGICEVGSSKLFEAEYLLKKGEIYTIRKLVSKYPFLEPGASSPHKELAVWLEEVVRSDTLGSDLPFGARRFRPVKNAKIEIFTQMLNPVKENA